MTDEQLTALAVEAKVEGCMEDVRWFYDQIVADERNKYLDRLSEAIDVSVKAERQACSMECIGVSFKFFLDHKNLEQLAAEECIKAILARNKK